MKKIVFYLIVMLTIATSAELLARISVAFIPELYDQRDAALARIDESTLQKFVETRANPSTGWDNPSGTTVTYKNCLGELNTYTFNPDRTRRHSASAGDAQIVIAGDSYTFGEEASDQSTFPAVLENLLNTSVANLGVNGYDPLQSFLRLDKMINLYPKARIVILAIMYDDFARLLNGYRPVYFFTSYTGSPYGFKPYLSHGQLHPLVAPPPWADIKTAWKAANTGFDTDYWRKPKAEFPYVASLVSAISTNSFYYKFIPSRLYRLLGLPEYQLLLNSVAVQESFTVIIDLLDNLAEQKQLATLVALIPRSGADTRSGADLIERIKKQKQHRTELVNIDTDIDWTRYNLKDDECHPSTYGYEAIAKSIAKSVQRLAASPQAH
ncbi:hypothetical protein [Bradyrhizobium sp. NBAIM01]|uniref:hypothetical protein n=1 Tax=Bradyrhizobium sp. NBAIM01 TaxID=2793818 RepID=UPI001CD47A5D|nr:hypothetical protein [Bradyrhizobium sp. NBAIM01]MCA1510378.1 hypothetical protein [Bradyrhizobium sp. NBAIM01]